MCTLEIVKLNSEIRVTQSFPVTIQIEGQEWVSSINSRDKTSLHVSSMDLSLATLT